MKKKKVIWIVVGVIAGLMVLGSIANKNEGGQPTNNTSVSDNSQNVETNVQDEPAENNADNEQSAKMSEYDKMLAEAVEVSWTTMLDDYEANPISADSTYKDKILMVTGEVSDIGREIMQQPYVEFEADFLKGVRLTFDKSEEDAISSLAKGDTISVIGKCTGELITGTVALNDCYIVR